MVMPSLKIGSNSPSERWGKWDSEYYINRPSSITQKVLTPALETSRWLWNLCSLSYMQFLLTANRNICLLMRNYGRLKTFKCIRLSYNFWLTGGRVGILKRTLCLLVSCFFSPLLIWDMTMINLCSFRLLSLGHPHIFFPLITGHGD